MLNSALLWTVVFSIISFSVGLSCQEIYGQLQTAKNSTSNSVSSNGNIVISVNSSVSAEVSNDTTKSPQGTLKSAVIDLLNSGSSTLKRSNTDDITSRTTITNKITDARQNVEGTEATNAIIGVEIGNAIKAMTLSSNQSSQKSIITLVTSSVCKSSAIICDNSVTIK